MQGQKDGIAEVLAKYAPNSIHVPSSNHPDIIAGQGTVALELLEQVRGNGEVCTSLLRLPE